MIDAAIGFQQWAVEEIVSGTARGADWLGEDWAIEHGVKISRFPADWSHLGKGAGFVRNELMADYADAGIALWDGKSNGTRHMIDQMKKRQKVCMVIQVGQEGA